MNMNDTYMLRTVMQRSLLLELYSSKLSEKKLGYIHAWTIIIIIATCRDTSN